jgi:hypothetical protein
MKWDLNTILIKFIKDIHKNKLQKSIKKLINRKKVNQSKKVNSQKATEKVESKI